MEPVQQMEGGDERVDGGWRAIGSAWLLVAIALALFVGFSAVTTRCEAWSRPQHPFASVVLPRHDPVCAGLAGSEACAPAATIDVEGATTAYAHM